MISLQPLHLTHSPSGTWIRLCSTGCLGFLIFLNHAISISSYPSRRGQRPESGGNHIATGGNGQEPDFRVLPAPGRERRHPGLSIRATDLELPGRRVDTLYKIIV